MRAGVTTSGRLTTLLARTACVSCLAAMPACAIDEQTKQSQMTIQAQHNKMAHHKKTFIDQTQADLRDRAKRQRIDKPWVAGTSMALAQEVMLPLALRKQINTTLLFRHNPKGIVELAKRIAFVTGIPVRVKPEARLPAYDFLPKLSQDSGAQTLSIQGNLTLDPKPQPLSAILDHVANQLDVYWQYSDGAIEFYRTQTRVFDVRALTLSAKTEAKLGKEATQGKSAFESASQTMLVGIEQPVLMAIAQRLEPFLTKAGRVAAQPGALSSIVVTDTPRALEAIAQYLTKENRNLSRRVRLVFEEFAVVQKKQIDYGLDWSLALSNSLAAAQFAMTSGMMRDHAVANMSAQNQGLSSYQANAIVHAISKHADILRHTTVPVVTMNRRPVTHAVRKTFSYVDQIQSSAEQKSTQGTTQHVPGVSVRQREETVGAFLTLVPDVQEDGQILLSVAYDNTVAQPLKQLSFGHGSNQLQVQQITIEGNGTVQQVALRSGEPTLIAGFERHEDENSQSRLSPDAPRLTGGSDQVGKLRSLTLVVVTAHVQESR